jgi:hypothetical protein
MGKLKMNLRRNLMVTLMAVMVVSIVLMPMVATGQTGVPDLSGVYFAKLPSRGYDIDGMRATFEYRYLGMLVTNTTDEGLVTGYLFGFNATSVKGARLYGNGRTYNATVESLGHFARMNLDFGLTTVNVTAEGTVGVYIPRYCTGEAYDGNVGVIEGHTVDLDEGWNTLNVTTAGDIDVAVWMAYSEDPIAEVFGIVGAGASAQFTLFATDIVTDVDDTEDDVLVGVETARVITPGATFEVDQEADGNITVYMPYGTVGNITADDCTVNGKDEVDLVEGTNAITVADNDTDGGCITVNVITQLTFQWSGRVRGSEGNYKLQGNCNWFSLPDNFLIFSGGLSANSYDYGILE